MQFRSHRYQTQYPIQLSTPAGLQQCRITDINNTGARILGHCTLRRGDKVKFKVLNDEISAVVCWCSQESAGILFRPQISSNQVDMLRYRRDRAHNQLRGSVGFGYAQM
ncbi:PilZ domain-containing protein [Yoonia maricola]|uniref:PilZ domain-containing protein n=1 Tax=Yoonia maricola TaxID=420999 RepID=UPI000C24F153